jgi:lysyl endopeptidase
MKRWLFQTLISLLVLAPSLRADGLPSAPQEVYRPAEPAFARAAESQRPGGVAESLRLPPLSDDELAVLNRDDGRRAQRIGVNRDLARYREQPLGDAQLNWDGEPGGGYSGSLVLASEGAAALRSHLRFERLPDGTKVLFLGRDGDDSAALEAVDIERLGNTVWSPTTTGDAQTIVVRLPAGASHDDLAFRIDSLSHIAWGGFLQPRSLDDVGDSYYCHLDVSCFSSPLIKQMADAVAKMVYIEDGGSFLCTGSLLVDTDPSTFAPFLYTAAHCLSTQEGAASLETYWFFQSTACESGVAAPFAARHGGATLLYTNAATDVTLLRLNQQPPAGAVYAGWDANPMVVGEEAVSPHHPSGDLKKISFGSFVSHGEPNKPTGTLYNRISWSAGITEGGSSGAGLFTAEGDNFYLRGGLWGGSSDCFNPEGPDLYSRFDLAYPYLAAYLDKGNAGVTPQSGWWWNPAESGRGFTIEVRGGNLFMAGFLYANNGRATWVSSGGPMSGTQSYSGQLVEFGGGQTLTGPYKAPTQTGSPGNVTLNFTAADKATMTWPGGTVQLQRFAFDSGTRTGGVTPETGWWWNPAESGRGFAIETQGNTLFIAGYMYDGSGNPIWFTANGTLDAYNRFQSQWVEYGKGQTLTGPYKPPSAVDSNAGSLKLQFSSSKTATMTLPNGRVISLSRFSF